MIQQLELNPSLHFNNSHAAYLIFFLVSKNPVTIPVINSWIVTSYLGGSWMDWCLGRWSNLLKGTQLVTKLLSGRWVWSCSFLPEHHIWIRDFFLGPNNAGLPSPVRRGWSEVDALRPRISLSTAGASRALEVQGRTTLREWLPTPVFFPGESHGQESLVGYSPRGCRELDTTEQLNTFHFQSCEPPSGTWGLLGLTLHFFS